MFCKKCYATTGKQVPALRVHNGVGMCETHYREFVDGPAPEPPAQQKENEAMPPKKDLDWGEIQKKRDAGVPATAICKEYGISSGSFYTKTKGPKKTTTAKKRKKVRFSVTKRQVKNSLDSFMNGLKNQELIGNPRYQELLNDLIARRDALNQAIDTIYNLK